MNRIITVIAITSVTFVTARALADDSAGQSRMTKRQLFAQVVGCMKKRMSASNTISYNEALKVCKDQIRSQGDNPSRTLVASDASTKP
jgi:hypothetical protein